ncbi:Ig-like domain-containing protein [Listeria grandensis]|uniref:Ig-like domain-containing protein n=1 Tax=Listeria grandensis TaxID=1494963 RepID=UPI00164E2F00|nr:Ig-like domain-containing protein [Listeria grandensis]MBC6314430.1 hypothetical protein [Listeria grandensis]
MMKLKTKIATATLLAGTCICIVGGTSWGGAEATIAKAATIPTNAKVGTVVGGGYQISTSTSTSATLGYNHYLTIISALRDGQTNITGTSGVFGDPNYNGMARIQVNYNNQGWVTATNTDYAGNWIVNNVTLRAGAKVQMKATFQDGTVIDREEVVKPKLNAPILMKEPEEGDSVISGIAEPGMLVRVRDYVKQWDLGREVKTSATGRWVAYLDEPLREGMYIYTIGQMYMESDYQKQSYFTNVGAAVNPTITSKLASGSTTVSGKSAGGANVELWSGTTKIGTTKADSLGDWIATVSPLEAGATLKVTATLFDKVKESIDYTVDIDKTVDLNTLTTNSTKVTGKGVAGATVVVKVEGTEVGRGVVGSNGAFEVTIPKQVEGTRVEITQTKGSAVSEATEIVVVKGLQKVTEISEVTTNSTKVTGKGHSGAAVKVKVAGVEIGTGEVGTDGNFEVIIKPQAVGTELTINQTKDGDESDSVTVTVVSAQLAAPSITTFYVGTTYLRGTAPTGAAKVTLRIAGKNIRTVDVAADGSYRIYANDVAALKIVGTTFEVVAQDANGKFSEVATGKVQGLLAAPVVATYRAGQAYVTGTVSDEVTKISVYDKADTLLRNGQVNADGTFRIYVSGVAALQIVGDTFTVRASDENGTTSETHVTIQPK